ncbi:MAG: response regulator transcription factor [Bacteroidetes bacterium]|nr:response regulator transcription factor [Bacteroidota bacterium]
MTENPKNQLAILVVEDEKKIAALIKKSLEGEEYAVETAYDGDKGEQLIATNHYDLIILDIMLPKKDGLAILSSIRGEKIFTPVLMLTAKGAVEDRVTGLDTGADDYLVKPFAIEELLARVRSLLRRKSTDKAVATTLAIADLSLDLVSRKAMRGGRKIELTSREFSLLEYFIRNKNKTLDRTMISQQIWNYNFDTGTNIIDVYINHLRAKIDGENEKKLFYTIRGIGYMMKDE